MSAAAAQRAAPREEATGAGWRDAPHVPPDLNGPAGWPFVPLPEDAPDLPLLRLVERAAAGAPGSLALDDGSDALSYATLLDRVRRLASAVARAVPPGGVVALALPVSTLQAACLLAVVATGRVAAVIDLHGPPQRRAALLEASGAGVALVDAAAGEALPGCNAARLDARRLWREEPPLDVLPAADPDAPAVILLTSGSTGEPKGIANGTAALVQRAAVHVAACHIGRGDRLAPLSAPSTIAGLRELLAGLLAGAAVHLNDPRGQEARHALERLTALRPTVVYAVPTLLRALCRLPEARRAFAALRVLRLGGEAVHWADVAKLRPYLPASARIMAAYSSTETPGAHWFVPPGARPDAPTVPAGYVAPGSRFRILGDDGKPAEEGADGELVLRGRFVALGHWIRGRLVPGPMEPDPEDPRARTFRTGDRARLLPDGRLAVLGRLDGMAKIAGQRVEPGEVEATMRGWPEVDDAAVIVAEAETGRAQLVAFLVPHGPAGAGLAEAAKRRLAAALPPAMQPARIHVLEAMPTAPGGKPDRAALARLDVAARRPPAARGEADPEVAWAVGRAWARSFGRRSYSADQRFQDAGGDSLALVRLAYDIEQRLGTFTFLPLDLFSPDMRPSELIASVSRLRRAPAAGPERAQLVLLPGLGGDEPLLALFRADLAERLQVTTPAYPGWRELAADNRLEAIAEPIARRIADAARGAPVRLAGYSFGGVVAAAVAARLLARGHEVGFLGLLDSAATAAEPLHGPALRRAIAGQGVMRQALVERRLADLLGMVLAENLARPVLRPLLAWLAQLPAPPLPRRVRFAGRAWLQALLRAEAGRAWLAQPRAPLPAPVRAVLFRSEAHAPEEPRDLGWGTRCAGLETVEVPGSHHGMFDPGNRALLAARVAAAVGA